MNLKRLIICFYLYTVNMFAFSQIIKESNTIYDLRIEQSLLEYPELFDKWQLIRTEYEQKYTSDYIVNDVYFLIELRAYLIKEENTSVYTKIKYLNITDLLIKKLVYYIFSNYTYYQSNVLAILIKLNNNGFIFSSNDIAYIYSKLNEFNVPQTEIVKINQNLRSSKRLSQKKITQISEKDIFIKLQSIRNPNEYSSFLNQIQYSDFIPSDALKALLLEMILQQKSRQC